MLLRLALLTPLVASLVALSTLSLAWSARGGERSTGASFLGNPSRQLEVIAQVSLEGSSQTSSRLSSNAAELLTQAPLEDEPFTIGAFAYFSQNRFAEARQMLEIAKRRNPRSRQARLLAVDVNLATGQIETAVRDLEALVRLMPAQEALFNETLILLAGNPETRSAALAAVKDNTTRKTLIIGLARSGVAPAIIVDAIDRMGARTILREDRSTINTIVQAFVAAEDFAAARQVWSVLVNNQAAQSALVRDRQFRFELPPPFGWEVLPGSDGFVTSAPEGIEGEIYGRRRATLARQLLTLPTGTYKLKVDVAEASDLTEVAIRCLPDSEIVEKRLATVGPTVVAFKVPQNCTAQWLNVDGRASDPPRSASFRLTSIDIARAAP